MSGAAGQIAAENGRADVDCAPMARHGSRLRAIRTAALLLLAGAVVNVLVGWACVIWLRPIYPWGTPAFTPDEQPAPDPLVERPGLSVMSVDHSERPRWGIRETLVFYIRRQGLNDIAVGPGGSVQLWHAGWPCVALACARFDHTEVVGGISVPRSFLRALLGARSAGPPRPLPYVPRWPGFAINTALYTALLACGFVGLRWSWRRLRRPPGACPSCGYDLTGNVTGVCPECGGKA